MKKPKPTIKFATMSVLSSTYAQDIRDVDAKIKTADSSIARLERKIKKLREERPFWVASLIQPIADAMATELHYRAEVSGPFGLGFNVCVFFYELDASELELDQKTPQGYLKFTIVDLSNGTIALRDYTRSTGEFAPNSVTELNDLHQPTIPIHEGADTAWFIGKMKELSASLESV